MRGGLVHHTIIFLLRHLSSCCEVLAVCHSPTIFQNYWFCTRISNFFQSPIFSFARICLYFFLLFYKTSGGFELRLINFFPASSFIMFSCFHNSLFFWFAQYCLSKIPLWCMGESDKAPTNKICRRASSVQRPRTRFCHESERLV